MIGRAISYVVVFLIGAAFALTSMHLPPYVWGLAGAFVAGAFVVVAIVVWFLNDSDIGPRF